MSGKLVIILLFAWANETARTLSRARQLVIGCRYSLTNQRHLYNPNDVHTSNMKTFVQAFNHPNSLLSLLPQPFYALYERF